MAKVLLGDVVDHVKDKVDKDSTDLEFYVGGEHIDGDEITVRRRGRIEGSTIGPAFHTRFQQGDVLLMSRNPHLRKASMVDFDGICSDVSYVCRTKDNNVLLQSLLPFILQTPEFWQFAEENKKGGLPFFLNWKDFARFEFELIPIDRQQQISNLLWAMERTKNAYRELIAKTDELVKSQFIERFISGERYPSVRLDAVSKVSSGLTKNSKRPTFEIKMPYLRVANVFFDYIDLDDVQTIGVQQGEIEKTLLKKGDVLFVEGNGSPDQIGRVAVWEGQSAPMLHQNHIIKARPDERKVLPRYCMYFFMTQAGRNQILSSAKTTSGLYTLSLSKIAGFMLPLAPLEEQQRFLQLVEQSDKSKFEAQQTLKELTDAQKAFMKKIFEQ